MNSKSSSTIPLLAVMAVVFVAYLVIGIALPVLPLHVHRDLGLGTFVVGLVAGSQFAASLSSRFWSGQYADKRGGKRALIAGLLIAAASGFVYLLSLRFVKTPVISVTILLLGRGVLGSAESFIVSGALVWGLALAGPENTGRVMAWVGTAMYVAFAVGAPSGTVLFSGFGFIAIAIATMFIPLVSLLLVARRKPVVLEPKERPSFRKIIGSVWFPGLGLALSSLGFGSITTFIVLLFAKNGWPQAWLSLTALSVSFTLGRIFFGHLPDRLGGARVAFISVLIEAAGQVLIWLAPLSIIALLGSTVTGIGYALVYPGFGVEAVRNVPVENRGLATGTYTAFLDLALGTANPALGLVAGMAGLRTVFLVSAIVVTLSAVIAIRLMIQYRPAKQKENTGRVSEQDNLDWSDK
ncbi:MAG: arabinose transporter [Syntrophothermus sp.]